jgi:hypothetical protein
VSVAPPTAAPAPGTIACPRCAAPVAPEQEWCLHCGAPARTRLVPTPNWRAPLIVLAVIATLAGLALAIAFAQLTSDNEPAAPVNSQAPPASATAAPPQSQAPTQPAAAQSTTTATAPAQSGAPSRTVTGQTSSTATGQTSSTTTARTTGTATAPGG